MHFRLISDLETPACADLQDRALHYGDGLFETMLLENSAIKFWPQHYRRLSASAKKLHIKCPSSNWFEQRLQPYFDLGKRLVIKLMLTRGSGGRGIHFPAENIPNVFLLKYNADNIDINQLVRVTFSEITLPENKNLAGLKHLNRLDYVLASTALQHHPEFDDALLETADGYLIEGIIHNLFFVHDNTIFTPDLSRCGVDGVMRQMILKNLKQMGKQVKIGRYSRHDLLVSDECFLCNSVQGIRPISAIDQQAFTTGPVTQQLQQQIYSHEGH
jgi:4-amino-4-deoxychorismate lyase